MQLPRSHQIRIMAFPALLLSVLPAVFYASYLINIFSTFSQPKFSDPNAMPWEERYLIRNETLYGYGLHKRQIYSPEQPKITKTISFKTQVYQKGHQRGEIGFYITPKGKIEGIWSADFTIGRTNYTTLNRTTGRYQPNSFRGNTAPSKIYQDENGQDKSKLYLITKGRYYLKARGPRTIDNNYILGEIYLTGWIDPNYNATGQLTVTEMWTEKFQTFKWEAKPLNLPN